MDGKADPAARAAMLDSRVEPSVPSSASAAGKPSSSLAKTAAMAVSAGGPRSAVRVPPPVPPPLASINGEMSVGTKAATAAVPTWGELEQLRVELRASEAAWRRRTQQAEERLHEVAGLNAALETQLAAAHEALKAEQKIAQARLEDAERAEAAVAKIKAGVDQAMAEARDLAVARLKQLDFLSSRALKLQAQVDAAIKQSGAARAAQAEAEEKSATLSHCVSALEAKSSAMAAELVAAKAAEAERERRAAQRIEELDAQRLRALELADRDKINALNEAHKELSDLMQRCTDLEARLSTSTDHVSRLQDMLAEMAERLSVSQRLSKKFAEEVAAIRNSTTWRMTSGVRKFEELRRRGVAKVVRITRRALSGYKAPIAPQNVSFSGLKQVEPAVEGEQFPVEPRWGGATPARPAGEPTDVVGHLRFRLGFWKLSADVAAHVAKHGPVTHIIALPWFAMGGAELAASYFAHSAAEAGSSVILLAVDRKLEGVTHVAAPARTTMLDLTDYFPDADMIDREALFFSVVRMIRPSVTHNINSEAAWRAIIAWGPRFRKITRLYGSIFAFQFDWKTGERIGYAANFLMDAIPHLDALMSDNRRFVVDAAQVYPLGDARQKLFTVYNPCRSWTDEERTAIVARVAGLPDALRRAERLQVLWAGRFDAEKRPDLLIETARLSPDMDFHVYGASIVDQEQVSRVSMPDNIILHGPYTSPAEVAGRREHHAFMFTSRWEGMPNAVIEFGALGLPVVAATVGGVGELIDGSTGYPLPERPGAEDYVAALRTLQKNPAGAHTRVNALIERITKRHNYSVHSRVLAEVPGYLPAFTEKTTKVDA